MAGIDEMRAAVEASVLVDSRHSSKVNALAALYTLSACAEAAEAEVARLRAELARAQSAPGLPQVKEVDKDQDATVRPEYEMHPLVGLAEAANMLAAEAAAQQTTIKRPFNGLHMRAWPGITGAQVVVDWYYALRCWHGAKQQAFVARGEVTRAKTAQLTPEQDKDANAFGGEAPSAQVTESVRLRAELAQARADAWVLAGRLLHFAPASTFKALTRNERDDLNRAWSDAYNMNDNGVVEALRRTLKAGNPPESGYK